jgi:RNA polymerase sigma-70 factor (family 1)
MRIANKKDVQKYLTRISKSDDQQAFQVIFELYFEQLLNFSVGYVKQSDVAEDILADMFIRLWENRQKLHTIENFDAYVFTSVKNQSLKHIEKKQRQTGKPLDEENLHQKMVDNYTPETEYEFKELNRKFNEAVEQLPDQCKRTFQLVKQDKLKYKDVAEILGISIKTVDAHVVKAVRRLREKFDDLRPKKNS